MPVTPLKEISRDFVAFLEARYDEKPHVRIKIRPIPGRKVENLNTR